MKNIFRSPTAILTGGVAVIGLALLLFVNAMTAADFAPPGRGFFYGRSNAQLAAAFALLTGLAGALLFLAARTVRSRRAAPRPEAAKPGTAAPEGEGAAGAKGETSAGVLSDTAEELKTTVDVLQEELEEILGDEVPADREHVQSLYEETGRLKKIIDSMEQLARVPALARGGKVPLPVGPLLQGIIETTRAGVTDREVAYQVECEPGLAMTGNPECIGLIIGNIADNAARSIRGSGSVTLAAERRGGLVVFSVRDTGTGIRRAQLPHIYERFFRGAGSGVGMGLSIVKELVDACGGKIEVRTEVNRGTTFTVELPAA